MKRDDRVTRRNAEEASTEKARGRKEKRKKR